MKPALEALLAKCADDAQRVAVLVEALALADAETEASIARGAKLSDQVNEFAQAAENFRGRFMRAGKAIAAARKILREDLRRFTPGPRSASRDADVVDPRGVA